MNKWTLFAALLVLAACGGKNSMDHAAHEAGSQKTQAQKLYHCPMHPSYTSDKPGECPICGMSLVEVVPEGTHPGHEEHAGHMAEGLARVQISDRRRQLIGLKMMAVEWRNLSKTIRTVGRIAYDPELYRTQEEYLAALSTYRSVRQGGDAQAAQRAKSLLESSRLRLNILGLSAPQIQELEKSGKPDMSLLIGQGKGGTLWLYADVYESELPLVKKGQTVTAATPSLPGEIFTGVVGAKDALINPRTRSARVRVEFKDPKGLLLPDMYLNAKIQIDQGRHLAVPKEAVIDTGERQVVFVDEGEGYLSPRQIQPGARSDDHVAVREGLSEGERVVTSGQFLVDSESNLKAALSSFSGAHQH